MKKLLLLFLITCFASLAYAQTTQRILKKNTLNKFVARPLDDLLDTLSANYGLKIVFERDSVRQFDVVEHFFNEPLNDVLAKVCNQYDLHYWIDAGGIIYVLQNVDDMERLKILAKTIKPIPPPKRDTIKADTPDDFDVQDLPKTKPKVQPKEQPGIQPVVPSKAPPVSFMVTISGKVVDQNTGIALPSATVRIPNTDLSATTNTDGNFTLFKVPSDTCSVEVSYSGYQSDGFKLNGEKLKHALVIGLYPALNTLNEVSIVGTKSGVMNTDTKKVGVLQLTPASLDKLPNLGEKDILRAFQLMPGVSGTNESSSGAYVRGGTPDQNLVVFDGFTVYQVDHLYGFFSAFNSNAIKDVQLYKGGFSAKYGGRLSSVTEINGKDGNRKEANFGVDLSLLSINLFAETPINDKSSLFVSFRRSYQGPLYDKIFKQFNTSTIQSGPGGGRPGGGGPPGGGGGFNQQTTPASHFYDADARYNYHLSSNDILTWSFYNGTDKTDNSRDLQVPSFLSSGLGGIKITDYTQYGNLGSSAKWFRQWNQKIHSNTYITYSSYFNDRDRTTSGTTTNTDNQQVSFSNGTIENNNLKDAGIKSDWEWQMSNNIKLLYGGFGTFQKINYDYIQNDTSSLISQHNKAFLGGGYTELEYDPSNKLHIQPGLRTTWFQPTGKVYLEPRLSASYVLNDKFTLKAATGQFYQFINEVTREDVLNGNRNFWVISNNTNIPVGQSRHYMGGISYENDQFLVDVEGYYKTLSNLTHYSIQQTGGGPGGGAVSVEQDFNNGSGFAKGIEILVQKKLGRYTGWLSYTLADAENKFAVFGSTYYPADQDIRHEFKSINMYHYQRWNFSAVFIFSTGHSYTAPLSTYTIQTVDGNTATYFNVGGKNAERLPNYHRLDLSATYDLLKISGNKIGSIGISLFNVYNHTNIWYREYQLQNNQAITTDVSYLGFTPNLTLSLRWK
jgi:ferric enterobactin receptor